VSEPVDLVLSSGFLAFGAHAGFLAGIEDLGLKVQGVCGTSSGALLGALWASGMSAREALAELTRKTPLGWARPCWAPWRGVLRLDAVQDELRARLPPTFDGLSRPFGVGVATPGGGHRLLTEGPLPEAVAASCAVPWLFAPVEVGGAWLADGGAVDRLGLAAWRARRAEIPAVVHLIDRSAGARGEVGLEGLPVVRSPRSGAQLWSLGDVEGAFQRSRAATVAILAG
jgi:predicted acylesterase/phospholipase RssA